MTAWTYTFCDMRTGTELATLPLTGVKYDRGLGSVGSLGGYLAVSDPKIRALDPWSATEKRRTALYVEYGDRTVWGGVVTNRDRSSDSAGLTISAVTWEGWLHRQRLLTDLVLTNQLTGDCAAQLVARAQVLTDVGLETAMDTNYGFRRSRVHLAREVAPILELIEQLGREGDVPLEFYVDCFRDPTTGRFRRVLRLGEPRIGRIYEDTPITFAYPDGGLTKWQLPEDGTAGNNVAVLLGSGSGALQPFGVMRDSDVGVDEIDSGYPSWMVDLRYSDTPNMEYIWARAAADLTSGLASEYLFTGVEVRPQDYLGQVMPGDDIGLEISHVSLKEWPAPVEHVTRVLGESVTVGSGGDPDSVSLTVGGAR